MFSLLVALTMYMTFAPTRPGLSVAEYRPPRRATLPLAAAAVRPAAPVKKDQGRLGVDTTARGAVAVDWRTGISLYEKNADAPLPIASVTKLMTALVVAETRPDWEREVLVMPGDERPGGIPYLVPGERVAAKDLFNLMLVASSNGAAVALARSTGMAHDEFVAAMNETAERIGMSSASFADPSGLDPKNVASARDVAALIKAAFEHQEIRDAVVLKEYAFSAKNGRPRRVRSTDELLGGFLDSAPYRFLGGKTGYLDEAGYCFAAAAEDADGNRVISVVLGSQGKDLRFREVKSLIFWAFDAYRWPAPLTRSE